MGLLVVNKATQSQKCFHQHSVLMNGAGIQNRGYLQRVRSVQQPSQGKEEEEGKVIGGDTAAAKDATVVGSSTGEGDGDAVAMESLQQQKIAAAGGGDGGITTTTTNKGVEKEAAAADESLLQVGLFAFFVIVVCTMFLVDT